MCEHCGRLPAALPTRPLPDPSIPDPPAPPAISPYVASHPPGALVPVPKPGASAPPGGTPCIPCVFCGGPTTTLMGGDGYEYDLCAVCQRRIGHFANHRAAPGAAPLGPPSEPPGTLACYGGPFDGQAVAWWPHPRIYCYCVMRTGRWIVNAGPDVASHAYVYVSERRRYEWRSLPVRP